MRYVHFIYTLIALYCFTANIDAQSYREQKKINKTFKIAPSGTLEISNKYGSVYVSTWDNDSVKVDLEFTIAEKNENRFKKIKNSVNFDFSGNNLYRSVTTQYGSSYSSLFKDFKEATNLFSSNEDQTHVDYYITIPDYINLKIENKYGNVILPNLQGDVNIQLSNGDFQARELKGNNRLNLSFGSARINHLEQANLTLNFMETRINTGNKITIDSKSSDIQIEETNLLKLTSKRGDIEVEKVNYLFSESMFCELYVNKVIQEANMDLKYGILKNIEFEPGFQSLKLNSENADIWLKLPEKDAFLIETSYLKANINSTRKLNWSPAKAIDDKGTLKKSGYYLNKDSSRPVNISISNANLSIE